MLECLIISLIVLRNYFDLTKFSDLFPSELNF